MAACADRCIGIGRDQRWRSESHAAQLRSRVTPTSGRSRGAWCSRKRARLDEVEQVLAAAGLGADAREPEAAEGLAADQGAGDAAVEVEVADAELASGPLQVRGLAAEDAAGQLVFGGVGDRRAPRRSPAPASPRAPGRRSPRWRADARGGSPRRSSGRRRACRPSRRGLPAPASRARASLRFGRSRCTRGSSPRPPRRSPARRRCPDRSGSPTTSVRVDLDEPSQERRRGTLSSTITRLQAEHFCPLKPKARSAARRAPPRRGRPRRR